MNKSATITARMTKETKKNAENVFKELGISSSEAINLFYKQVILNQGLPFDVKIPNSDTLKAIMDVEKNNNLTRCENAEDMFKSLGI